jgi:hypothetical protein
MHPSFSSTNDALSIDVYVVGLSENLVGVSRTPSTAAPIWLPLQGVLWSEHPHRPWVDRVRVTAPSFVGLLHPDLFGVRS